LWWDPTKKFQSSPFIIAVQTFIVQLVGPGTYLPTEKAIRAGHYSAVVHSSLVSPEGGNVLVNRTVIIIDLNLDRTQRCPLIDIEAV